MKYKDRLTRKIFSVRGIPIFGITEDATYRIIVQRLGSYEDTGLSPFEIQQRELYVKQLLEEKERLKKELNKE